MNKMNNDITHKRLMLLIPPQLCDRPIVSQLVSGYGLVVNILAANLRSSSPSSGRLDLELVGSVQQIQLSLNYLASLNIQLVSKFQTAGDCWDY